MVPELRARSLVWRPDRVRKVPGNRLLIPLLAYPRVQGSPTTNAELGRDLMIDRWVESLSFAGLKLCPLRVLIRGMSVLECGSIRTSTQYLSPAFVIGLILIPPQHGWGDPELERFRRD